MWKNVLKGVAFVQILLLVIICAVLVASVPPTDGTISVEELAKNGSRYGDEKVKVRGFCNIQFEGFHGLYSHDFREKKDEKKPLYALWIDVPEEINPFDIAGCRDGEGEFVVIEGRLGFTTRVPDGLETSKKVTIPTLVDVTKIERWSAPQ